MKLLSHDFQFVVIGAGFAGMCAAITAARAGINSALVQDRPVLGGNAGKEVRITPVGADNCNFLYSRETGLIEEIMLKNLHDNPDFSYEGFKIVLNGFIKDEPNLTCFLNTSVMEIELDSSAEQIRSVKGYTTGSETWHTFNAPFFADCTGDGTVGALAGAPFRMGIEAQSEFNEPMCKENSQPYCMGGSVQFHAVDTGSPKLFRKPEWLKLNLDDEDFGPTRPVTEDFFRNNGGYWWIEIGGDMDTVHDTEKIREGASEIVYATWDYLKNKSPIKEQLINYELDWVSPIAGKRESRRLEGDYILTMGDIQSQRDFPDAVAFGGWGFDHHPPGGFFDNEHGSCHVYHAGPYNIPLRCLYSKSVTNLFMAGRNISASHYALSSTRVMFTTAQLGEAVGMTAAHCIREKKMPRQFIDENRIDSIQNDLIRSDHHIHNWPTSLPDDIAPEAKVTASSVLPSPDVKESNGIQLLSEDKMLLFPVVTDYLQGVDLCLDALADTTLEAELFQGPENIINRFARPTNKPNLWSSDITDFSKPEWIELGWDTIRSPKQIDLIFDSMLDFHFIQKWGAYQKNVLPSIVKHYRLWAYDIEKNKTLIAEASTNYQRLCKHHCVPEKVKSIR